MTGCHGPKKSQQVDWPRLAAAGHDSNLMKSTSSAQARPVVVGQNRHDVGFRDSSPPLT